GASTTSSSPPRTRPSRARASSSPAPSRRRAAPISRRRTTSPSWSSIGSDRVGGPREGGRLAPTHPVPRRRVPRALLWRSLPPPRGVLLPPLRGARRARRVPPGALRDPRRLGALGLLRPAAPGGEAGHLRGGVRAGAGHGAPRPDRGGRPRQDHHRDHPPL